MNKTISILSMEYAIERMLLPGLFSAAALLILMYLYFVSASVMHVIARQEAISVSSSLQSSISVLEKNYFTLSQSVTPAKGSSLGLAPISTTNYVYRPGTVGVAETSDGRI